MPDGHGYQPKGGTVVDTASLAPPVGGSAVQEKGESLHDYAKRMSQTLEPAEPQPDEDEDPLITEVRLLRMAVERAADALEKSVETRKASNEFTAENRDGAPAGESARVPESDVLGQRQASFDDPDNQ